MHIAWLTSIIPEPYFIFAVKWLSSYIWERTIRDQMQLQEMHCLEKNRKMSFFVVSEVYVRSYRDRFQTAYSDNGNGSRQFFWFVTVGILEAVNRSIPPSTKIILLLPILFDGLLQLDVSLGSWKRVTEFDSLRIISTIIAAIILKNYKCHHSAAWRLTLPRYKSRESYALLKMKFWLNNNIAGF